MILTIKKISKKYPNGFIALDNVSFNIQNGMVGILGPNGAGKTTLMKILSTLLLPTKGECTFNNIDIVKEPKKIRSILGYLPQDFQAYNQLTVWEFLDYCATLSNLHNKTKRINEILEEVNLIDKKDDKTSNLSGGMMRRLGIAQALLNNPRLLIVDEPTAGLDPAERIKFRNLIASLSGERVVLLSTHIVEDIANTCNQLIVINKGKLIMQGTPDELAKKAEGKVWEIIVKRDELLSLQKEYSIISTVLHEKNTWKVKLLSNKKPLKNAKEAKPGIEEGYMELLYFEDK